MSLITKDHLSLTIRTLKKLLSFKADKDEVIFRNEIEDSDAIELAMKTGLIIQGIPIAEDGSIYTDENGVIYTL